MHRYKIELVTASDIASFVGAVSALPGRVRLMDDTGFCINGKSLLGAMAAVEWDTLYCESDDDIYSIIEKYCR